jgi:membrane protein involved in colicin uptake
MNRILAGVGLAAALVLPMGAVAKPDETEKRTAIAECKDERGKSRATREAFKTKYHSFSRCVQQATAEEEAQSDAAKENASKECKAERDLDRAAFEQKYGTNKNKKNALGKCVSGKAAEQKAAMDAADAQEAAEVKNAAKECAAERKADRDAFAQKYGTGKNKRNAFGKCVSGKTGGS